MLAKTWLQENSFRSLHWKNQKGRCCYCNTPMVKTVKTPFRNPHTYTNERPDVATLEHLQRQCEGGLSTLGNTRLACRNCNNTRGETNWLEYKTQKEKTNETY